VAEPAQGIVPEAELEHAPVVVELERVPVEAELALVRVEVGPEPDPLRAQVAVALRTKSVTAAHRRGLPLLTVEDLAVVAETTREPAATEAARAWEAADSAAVEAAGAASTAAAAGVVVVAAVAVVAAEAGDEKSSVRKHK
jgi:hypothetical protein